MPPRRTVRKPTRWTPEEWAQVEAEARARGVPPLRYVREVALGRPPAPRRTRAGDELVKQLGPTQAASGAIPLRAGRLHG